MLTYCTDKTQDRQFQILSSANASSNFRSDWETSPLLSLKMLGIQLVATLTPGLSVKCAAIICSLVPPSLRK